MTLQLLQQCKRGRRHSSQQLLAAAALVLAAILLSATLPGADAKKTKPWNRSTGKQPGSRACGAETGLTPEMKMKGERLYHARIVQRYGADSPQAKAFVPAARREEAKAAAATMGLYQGAQGGVSPDVESLTKQALAGSKLAGGNRRHLLAPAVKKVTIPTVFHVIKANDTIEGGNVASKVITSQVKALNKAYKPYSFTFKLTETNYVTNATWFSQCANFDDVNPQNEMKQALRKGGVDTLNVYTCDAVGNGLLGFATFPWWYYDNTSQLIPNNLWDDGVVIELNSMPGGSFGSNYSLGHTLTHEVGHWLGLYHVFNEAVPGAQCIWDGWNNGVDIFNDDMIADTPPQLNSTHGCPADDTQDTCPTLPGFDNIHNYMDYSFDSCYTEFSWGQAARSWGVWAAWRAP